MKYALFLGAFTGLAVANINFHWVQPTCDFTSTEPSRCLKGQQCTEANTCEANVDDKQVYLPAFRRGVPAVKRQNVYSTDGTCGPANGNTICDPTSTKYSGSCCSQYGWCGNSAAYCGTGCLSGCGGAVPAAEPPPTTGGGTAPRTDARCGKDFAGATCDSNGPFGGCCSAYGYCGSTEGHCLPANGCQNGCTGSTPATTAPVQLVTTATRPPSTTTSGEPVLGKPSSLADPEIPTGKPTIDGTCGATFANTICGTWYQGSCCSMYGYCGDTASHCGAGCQSGPCLGPPATPPPAPSPAPAAAKPGTLAIKGRSGVPAMHAALLPNGRVVFLDKVEDFTELKLPNGQFAYSSEYDPNTERLAPLAYTTNAFCAGGIFLADGQLLSAGGNAPLDFIDPTVGDGFKGLRLLKRSATDASLNGQNWAETSGKLSTARWYASLQTMPDGTIFVASGSLNGLDPAKPENNNPTYEILNANGTPRGTSIPMAILSQNQPYYMYPFIHLMRDGNLFVFTSKSSEIFNVGTNTVVKSLPDLRGDYRTYPNTGGSVMLPLSSANQWNPDIVICGGGPYQDITAPCDPSCGRIQPLGAGTWELDSMPQGRGMVEGTLLADGSVIWVNGANKGAQGFDLAANPTLDVLIYDSTQKLGKRWTTGAKSTIPRLYHSVALLLLDGTLLISGSNPVEQPMNKPTAEHPYVTEFRNEIYTPPYLQDNPVRPSAVVLSSKTLKANGSKFTIKFNNKVGSKAVKVSLYYGGFVTHSVHMGHRMAFLDTTGFNPAAIAQTITVTMPPNKSVAPPGPYVVYVLVDGVPAIGQFVIVS